MGNVLGDGTVSFTPANGDTPATLTLNGANITTRGEDNSLFCCKLSSGRDPESMEPPVYYPLNIVLSGTNNVSDSNTGYGISCSGPVTISGSGSLTTHVRNYGIYSDRGIKITSGIIDAENTGNYCGTIQSSTVEISGGTVTATSTGTGSVGINGFNGVTISGGEITAIGLGGGIYGTVKNSMAGTGWTNTADTEGEETIAASTEGQSLTNYKKVHFLQPPHIHAFTYSASGATITATCEGSGTCDITDGLTLTISAPTGNLVYDGTTTYPATLSTGYNTTAFPGTYSISYKKDGSAYSGVPKDAGTYTASVTAGTGDAAKTASVSYTIAKAAAIVTKAPEAKTLTYTGSAQELVTAGTAEGGTMQYALGTATEATEPYTTSIPTATNVGT